ncbi:MAG: hypothetical protein KA175_09180 [Flavobacteriales bacterium]|nr:hypothetical protein [Flavobacteriales bacterium]MBP6697778.1 hypothetical protein [Flavobacteriales bacterium]
MRVLEELASAYGRNDEQPNIALAEVIVKKRDAKGVSDLIVVLSGKDKALRNDAIKVLYEVGARRSELIAMHLGVFVGLLASKDNRMVWGAMCAVDAIADTRPKAVVAALPKVMAAVDKGSVITRDHAVKAMVKLAANKTYARTVLPLLHEQLRTCPVNQLPMYAELVATIQSVQHAKETSTILAERLLDVPHPPKRRRIEKVLRYLKS